tara:strand:- start:105 stop:1730 length:1626 start_codon:yes stop_codon:yes gene_type:complete
MKRFIILSIIVSGFLPLGGAVAADEKAARPNVVIILADDLGFSDLGCYGGEISTPNLDRLAGEGMRFTQFYNCGVCRTTRATLLTGVDPRRRNRARLLHPDMVTLAEVLGSSGYRTGIVGKWHFAQRDIGFPVYRPTDRGFERYYGIADGACNFFDPAKPFSAYHNSKLPLLFLDGETEVTEFPDDYYATDAFTERAIEQLREFAPGARSGEAPFFLHLCYTAPHYPLHAKPEDIEKYKGKYSEGYEAMRRSRHQRLIELGILSADTKLSPADPEIDAFRYDYAIPDWETVPHRDLEERRMEVYAAMVDSMDQGIGRFLNALEEEGVVENTLVVFLSDNGGCASHPGYRDEDEAKYRLKQNRDTLGSVDSFDFVGPGWGWAQNAPFRRYKVWNYEGGIATPMIARWPGTIEPGAINNHIGHVIDFMPTVMEMSGADYPLQRDGVDVIPLEGQSLLPALRGKEEEKPRFLHWGLYGNRAVRQGKWKMVWGTTAKKWELYNLKVDRSETQDVIEKHPNQARRMRVSWERWAKKTGYPLTGYGL